MSFFYQRNLKTFVEKQKVLLPIFISVVVFSLFLAFGPYVMPETYDDRMFMLLAAGAFGDTTFNLIPPNIIYGGFLRFFYIIIPQVNWYLFFQYAFNLCAISMLSIVLTNKYRDLLWRIITPIIVGVCFGESFYLNIQYTTNSFLYFITGGIVCLSVCLAEDETKHRIAYCIGSFFITLSFMQRWHCSIFLCPFYFIVLCVCAIKNKVDIFKFKGVKWFLRLILPLILGLLLSLINIFSVKYNAEWAEYEKFFEKGSRLVDYMPAVYQLHPNEYLDAGITEMDIVLFNNLISMDTETFTTDHLAEMVRIKSQDEDYRLKLNGDIITEIVGCLHDMIKQMPILFSLLFLCTIFILFKGNKMERLVFGVLFILFISEIWFIVCRGRAPMRILLGPALALTVFTVWLIMDKLSELPIFEVSCVKYGSLLFACTLMWGTLNKENANWWQGEEIYVIDALSKDKNHKYVMDTWILCNDGLGIRNPMTITATNYSGYFNNIVLAGGFIPRMPNVTDAGLNNPVRSLVNKDVFWVTKSQYGDQLTGVIDIYLEEKLQREIGEYMVIDTGDIQIWKFY